MNSLSKTMPIKEVDPHAYYAVHFDKAYDASYEGWGLVERRKRASLLQQYVDKRQKRPPAPEPPSPVESPTNLSSGNRL